MEALVILLLVARGEANEPTTLGAVRATHELLGGELEVTVRELDAPPSDEQALELARAARAEAVIELSWDSAEHRQAYVRFHVEPRRGWNDRVIGFNVKDDLAERGRTIGFAVASMLPARAGATETARAAPHAAPWSDVESAPAATSPSSTGETHRWRGAFDVLGSAAMGIGGEAPGWGGSMNARWYLRYPFGVAVGASARAGQIDPAQATALHTHLSAGVVWLPMTSTAGHPIELGVRVDALAVHERLRHYDSDDPAPIDAARWVPGADAAIEGAWLFNPTAGLVAAVTMESIFGETDVTLHHERVATLPVLRLVLQAGVRASF